MKNVKGMWKKAKVFLNKYINGTRGAISLLMALIMSPLLSVSLLLVESVRYQNAVEALVEITGCSSFSVLADYDSYLDERFGILAVSQESNINDVFGQYMQENIQLLGDAVTLDKTSAKGCYAFNNTDVLKQQLLEYSEVSVAAEVLVEGINLEDLLDDLTETLGLEEVKKGMDAVSGTADIATEAVKIGESLEGIISKYEDYKIAKEDYDSAYTSFCTEAENYINAIKAAEEEHANQDETETENEEFNVYEDPDVVSAWQNLSTARDKYKSAVDEMKTQLDEMRKKVNTLCSAVKTLAEKARGVEDNLQEEDATTTWVLSIIEQITETIGTEVSEDIDDQVNPEIQALEALSAKIGRLSKTTMDSTWTSDKVKTEYKKVSITSITQGMIESLKRLNQKLCNTGIVTSTASGDMATLLDLANDLLGLSALYDTALNANIGSSYIYAGQTMSLTSQAAIESVKLLITSCEDVSSGIENKDGWAILRAIGNLLASVVSFFAAVIAWVAEALVNLVKFTLSGPKEWYNSLLLYGYGIYNCPNRTTYKDGKSISGYEYNNIFTLAGGQNNGTLGGTLEDLAVLNDNVDGTDKMFKGAEGEYLLVGAQSEILNQTTAFFNVFLFRLALDIGPILKSAEVKAMSATAGPLFWLVMVAVIIIEPLIDGLILANGGDVSFFKGTSLKNPLYCTITGIPKLLEDIVAVSGLSDGLVDRLKKVVNPEDETSPDGGTEDTPDGGTEDSPDGGTEDTQDGKDPFKVSYSEHLLLLMVLSVDQSKYLQRMQNIVQMEAACKYQNDYEFSLSKTYTYIRSDIEYTLNPMFDIDALTQNGIFTKTKRQYTGY